MKLQLKKVSKFLLLLTLTQLNSLSSFAQANISPSFPSKSINFIVPYTTGTTADVLARLIGLRLASKLNVPVVVDNKAGASGIIGTDAVSKAPPNGYTYLFTATSHGTTAAIKNQLPFDPIKSFTPVILLGTSAMGFVTAPDLQTNTVKEFIELAKSKPNQLDYSTPGAGGIQHLAMELFLQETGLKLTHVPYKGSSGAMTDVIAGHVKATIVSLQTASPFITNGQLKMIAVMSDERSTAFPQVPTFKELGFSGLVVDTWYGVLAPLNTPKDIINTMNNEINLILTQVDAKDSMVKLGLHVSGGKPDKLEKLLSKEIPKWISVVQNRKISVE
ncbi:MAG: tripartite tricarboxylate transporter substrate binding protein [Betaproteobacteria bacterium]|jgi:tripartite-type tricarboxylate transporter receptor subunit TctC